MKIKKLFWTRKQLIREFAKKIAELQMKADKWFYVHNDQDQSNWYLDQFSAVKDICERFGICTEAYQEAYKIYDFRNSGKKDFVPDMELLKSI